MKQIIEMPYGPRVLYDNSYTPITVARVPYLGKGWFIIGAHGLVLGVCGRPIYGSRRYSALREWTGWWTKGSALITLDALHRMER